ncbi:MAG: hypothetical protein JNM24_14385 [Bdellovibrionaceae bacterium]|nr:hypothetical protein [Pseudobdellovibrionaceae bacterium]
MALIVLRFCSTQERMMNTNFPIFNEGPIASLMRLKSMSLAESQKDFQKRQVTVEIKYLVDVQRWQMSFIKNENIIFQKTFSKSCRSAITGWFLTYDLDQDIIIATKVPWKALERGEKWAILAYVNRRYWNQLELPVELSLCQIIKMPEHRWQPANRIFSDWDDMGKVLKLPIRKKRR